ncbi:LysM peptidoglycan-binding domain-containing protein [Serinicoccus marinus]|uniref:LysM peptidoglycan-binding domain-containing protein n=1 Tax=Serinicoccus marinus TaxID=247333 RepID=UPI0003B78EF1|nr:Gmad2 immunoglobulin-like domain-containing protein [Serinicoccus marinus]
MSIRIQQPQQYDLVSDTLLVAGTAGGAFEATFNYRVSEGHDEVVGHFSAGDGVGGHGQFQVEVDLSGAAFTRPLLTVEVFWPSPRDGDGEMHTQTVQVVHGPQVVPGYAVYQEHTVVAGDTLWGIADHYYGDGSLYHRLVTANPGTITDPDVISVGQVVRVPRTAG